MVVYATRIGATEPYSIRHQGPVPQIDKEEGLPPGGLDIAWVDSSRKNNYHWSSGLKWYERLYAHATLNSARKNAKCKRPFEPKDYLDMVLDSVYCPQLETFSEKSDPYLQNETMTRDEAESNSWRLLKNRRVMYPDKSVAKAHPVAESSAKDSQRRENIYNVKLGSQRKENITNVKLGSQRSENVYNMKLGSQRKENITNVKLGSQRKENITNAKLGYQRRENIYNVKLGIAADHSPQTNPGYSRTPSGAFYSI